MYEDITCKDILKRMLDRVPSNVDKREGSIIYDALAPAAVEMKQMYIELNSLYNATFADSASRDELIRRAAEIGLTPKPATYAVLKGVFNIDVPIGSRFSGGGMFYTAREKISDGVYRLQCEVVGTKGNQYYGSIIPASPDYIGGLTRAEITEILVPGEDEEDTELFRSRYFQSFDNQAFGGNITDYKQKTKSLPGVGGVKVFPAWNGGGTVKLIVIDSTYASPSETLVSDTQEAIDPIGEQGQGIGIAPIDHIVTVEAVQNKTVNILTSVTFVSGYTWNDVEPYVRAVIEDYFLELSKMWENEENLVVRISQIESAILHITGVVDIQNTKLNGSGTNLILTDIQIPILGTVTNI